MSIQVKYYSYYYSITKPEKDKELLIKLHQARKVKRDGKLTYDYQAEDRLHIQTDSAKCIACHGTKKELDKNNKPKFPIHKKMLSAPMLNFLCTHCHKQVDIRKRRPGRATITVDRTLCPKCHNAPNPAQKGNTAVSVSGMPIPPQLPALLVQHGATPEAGKKWISRHPRVAMAVGIFQCRKCHKYGSELDFCNECHLRGGFRPSSHKALYKVDIKTVYPKTKNSGVVNSRWKGFHFVFARSALKKLGYTVKSPQNLPMDKLQKLPCGACHVLEEWCTKCHIKHNPNWLNPTVGHPAFVNKYGTGYCFKCHDHEGTKCVSCHTYVGKVN